MEIPDVMLAGDNRYAAVADMTLKAQRAVQLSRR